MKRSEMLEIISTTLDKTDFVDTEMCWTMRAEIVLKAIEKAGMLPPAKHVDIASGKILHYHIHDSVEESGELSEIAEYWNWCLEDAKILWESEDEKK